MDLDEDTVLQKVAKASGKINKIPHNNVASVLGEGGKKKTEEGFVIMWLDILGEWYSEI